MIFDNYEILHPYTNNNNNHNSASAIYKVRLKVSNEIYLMHEFDYDSNSPGLEDRKTRLLDKINARITLNHPNLLRFYDVLTDVDSSKVYVITEWCCEGNLHEIINNCQNESKHLEECSIYKIVFQLLCVVKTVSTSGATKIHPFNNINDIYLDQDFNVKLYNFIINGNNNGSSSTDCYKSMKTGDIGALAYHLCTLKPHVKSEQENELKKMKVYYSSEFIHFLNRSLKNTTTLYKNIDKILCGNPSMLLKSCQWNRDKRFFTITNAKSSKIDSNNYYQMMSNASEMYKHKLDNMRNRETALQLKEEKLNAIELDLMEREKKLILSEMVIREKLLSAELYLKRCRRGGGDSSNSKSTISTASGEGAAKSSVSNTEKVMNGGKGFVRSKSERRVRFKGHSPLKDLHYNPRKSLIKSKNSVDKSNYESNSTRKQMNKKLFVTNENDVVGSGRRREAEIIAELAAENDCRPTTVKWTSENKRYAFDLLRIMNNSGNATSIERTKDIKHTYL